MKNINILLCFITCYFLFNCTKEKQLNLNVLQFNIWQEGTVVENGFNAIVDEIIRTDADLIAFSEVRNYNSIDFDQHIVKALKQKGHIYYAERSQDTGLLSRYPILSQTNLYPVKDDHGSITKAIINVKGVEVAFYSGHLDYLNCALYLPRAYDGSTWKKLENPITEIQSIEKVNLASKRDEAIDAFIYDAENEIKQGKLIIYCGDNNEPSHLDWIEENKHLYDHNGVVINWRNTFELQRAGFKDVYREKYPNPMTHPGFTYPANNEHVQINKLAWSPEADDRDRIDFIFYHPNNRLQLKDVNIIGPKGDIIRNKRTTTQPPEDIILDPIGVWPTDHKAVLANFKLSY